MTSSIALALALSISSLTASGAAAAAFEPSKQPDSAALINPAAGLETEASTEFDADINVEEPAPSNTGDNDWNVAFTPYLWIAGTSGEVGIPRESGGEVEIDKSFADVLGNLNFAFMGALDVEHNRFVALGDVMYLSVTAKAEGIRDEAFVEGKVDASVLAVTGMFGYRVVDQGPMFVDLLAGARLVSLDVDLELEGPNETRNAGASPSGITPVLGGRVRVPLGKKWGLAVYSDVGSLFDDADVKWQVVGTIQRDLGRHWRLAAGYRHMSINHSKDDMDFDVSLSGPIVGVTYKF